MYWLYKDWQINYSFKFKKYLISTITMNCQIFNSQNRWGGSKRDHLSAFNSVQFTMYYTFFFNVDAVVCQNNGQFQWSILQKVVSLRLIVSVFVSVISKLLIGWNSHLRLILDLQLFVKSTTGTGHCFDRRHQQR
jgi:hypothetical protein